MFRWSGIMRVALCLYGHFRTFNRCYQNLKNHVLDIYHPDIFTSAWTDTMGFWQPRDQTPDAFNHPGYYLESPAVPQEYIDTVFNVLRPKYMYIDSYTNLDANFQGLMEQLKDFHNNDPNHAPKSCLSMNFIRQQAIQLKRRYEIENNFVYDHVIVTRWDINHSLPIDLNKFDPDVITFEKGGGDHPGDTWAAGPSALLDLWGEQFNGIQELVDAKTMSLGPHEWQTAWFNHKKIPWVNRTDIGTHFIR